MKEIGRLLVEARRTRKPLVLPAGVDLQGDADAYRVQDAVFAALWPGVRAAAWKVGGPGDNVEPTAAPIPPALLMQSPASVAAAGMSMIGVEAEVAFRLSHDLRARGRPYGDEEVAAAIGEVLVTIELCDTRLANWKDAPVIWKLADFQTNGALVTGSGTRDWRRIDFLQQEARLAIGSRTYAFKGNHSFGNPLRLMPWLAAHCAVRSGGLRAGDVVTTGSWTGMEFAAAGDVVTAVFPGIGEATVSVR